MNTTICANMKSAENITQQQQSSASKQFEDIHIHTPFINKYQPEYLSDFQQLDETTVKLVKSLIHLNNLNILIVGDSGTGKTSIIKSVIKEYYGNGNEYNH